ncbi:glycosyltransferase [Pelistega europaea]|uniref:Glycosyltransferase n=1 Tax=Pelistega europaea TaxID=106147 RepID=A0A7Y4P712_9BURK|nr:glycosyltransferase [Pelistega europaea]NOL50459.1 glycosyltransferase [Pelistega europaea]
MTFKVVHLISGLGQGGAETVLTRLVTHSNQQNIVVSFGDEGVYGATLKAAGVSVYTLGMQSGKLRWQDLKRLIALLKRLEPDVIQTWMYHADFFGGIAARLAGFKHIAWGIRNSGDSLKNSSKTSYYLARLSAFCSRFIPQRIIVCGEKAAKIHTSWGYQADKMVVIQNGYDLRQWQANPTAGAALRQAWRLTENTPLLGFVARWNPLKDHPSLIKAFALTKKSYPDAVLALIGKGLETSNSELMALLSQQNLQVDRDVLLLGLRTDVPMIMSALDIHVLSSIAEGFPNVVCESMACQVPNVVTDVGDAALIVGNNGWIAQPANPDDLADKLNQALALLGKPHQTRQHYQQFDELRQKARQSVLERFSLETMVQKYEHTWESMIEGHL